MRTGRTLVVVPGPPKLVTSRTLGQPIARQSGNELTALRIAPSTLGRQFALVVANISRSACSQAATWHFLNGHTSLASKATSIATPPQPDSEPLEPCLANSSPSSPSSSGGLSSMTPSSLTILSGCSHELGKLVGRQ
jgi:hypothetical protein